MHQKMRSLVFVPNTGRRGVSAARVDRLNPKSLRSYLTPGFLSALLRPSESVCARDVKLCRPQYLWSTYFYSG
jgi:hypothetical protein